MGRSSFRNLLAVKTNLCVDKKLVCTASSVRSLHCDRSLLQLIVQNNTSRHGRLMLHPFAWMSLIVDRCC